jgi:catechol 2,3-dioxygenase-like lactoylglutathione lyase family enzyme
MSDAAMGFLHVGMKVHDIERATRCYAAAFGLVLDGRDFAFFAGDDLGGVLAQLVHFKQPRN